MALCCLATSLHGQHQVTLRTNYYAVSGRSLAAIHQSLSRNRPWPGREGRDARTEWKLHWHTTPTPAPEGCRVAGFKTDTQVTMTLPALQVPSGTPPEVIRAWQRYLRALMRHELGHVRITREAAQRLQARVAALQPAPDCADLKRQIDAIGRDTLRSCRARHRDYDRRTRHGATEGAILPRRPAPPAPSPRPSPSREAPSSGPASTPSC